MLRVSRLRGNSVVVCIERGASARGGVRLLSNGNSNNNTNGSGSGDSTESRPQSPFGVSLRDSFRRVEAQRTSSSSPMNAHVELLRAFTAKTLNKYAQQPIEADTASPKTDGEKRYQQQQVKIEKKREMMQERLGSSAEVIASAPQVAWDRSKPSAQLQLQQLFKGQAQKADAADVVVDANGAPDLREALSISQPSKPCVAPAAMSSTSSSAQSQLQQMFAKKKLSVSVAESSRPAGNSALSTPDAIADSAVPSAAQEPAMMQSQTAGGHQSASDSIATLAMDEDLIVNSQKYGRPRDVTQQSALQQLANRMNVPFSRPQPVAPQDSSTTKKPMPSTQRYHEREVVRVGSAASFPSSPSPRFKREESLSVSHKEKEPRADKREQQQQQQQQQSRSALQPKQSALPVVLRVVNVLQSTEWPHPLLPEVVPEYFNESTLSSAKSRELVIPYDGLTLRAVASRLSLKLADVRAKLIELGEEDKPDVDGEEHVYDADIIELLVLELGHSVKRELKKDLAGDSRPSKLLQDADGILPRAPVVSITGHVDHGKTTLLDALRGVRMDKNKKVAGSEAGGITQRLSAFAVDVSVDDKSSSAARKVVFVDTPGHAAFSSMRGHSALATDIAVLVVAMDDGVKPQTQEAIKIAKANGNAIVVALSKADVFANSIERSKARSRVCSELAQNDVLTEDYGGDVQVVEVSGKTGEGVHSLIESLVVQADIMDLRASTQGQAEAVVLDAYVERGRGIVAELLVKWGALSVGDIVVVGNTFGKVKSMFDDKGKPMKKATPGQPVKLLGLRTVPSTGSELISVDNESDAKKITDRRERMAEIRTVRDELRFKKAIDAEEAQAAKAATLAAKAVKGWGKSAKQAAAAAAAADAANASVEEEANKIPLIGVVLKADSLGAVEALRHVVEGIAGYTNEVEIRVVGSSVGDVALSDVQRMSSIGDAMVLGFNVHVADNNTKSAAKQLDIPIELDNVIYRLEEALVQKIESYLPKVSNITKRGTAKVLKLFRIKKGSESTVVAGCSVTSGQVCGDIAGSHVYYKVLRNGVSVLEQSTGSVELKRFKDIVREVESGNECGISLSGFNGFEENDELECYVMEFVPKSLQDSGYVPSRQFSQQASTETSSSTDGDSSNDSTKSKKKNKNKK